MHHLWNVHRTSQVNNVFVDSAENLDTAMPIYNLIEYKDNYSDASGNLWLFKRDETLANKDNVTIDNSTSLKHKSSLTRLQNQMVKMEKNMQKQIQKELFQWNIWVTFWKSLELPLIIVKFVLN